MRTRNSYFQNNSSVTIPRRQNKRRTLNEVEPEFRTIVEVAPMADNHTMEELLQAPTEGCGEAIFFPPSKTTHLKIEISHFTQRFEETFREAWERFKEMLRACPHHGFNELAQIDTFYNGLNDNDQDSLNVVAGGNLLIKTTREALQIIENKSKSGVAYEGPSIPTPKKVVKRETEETTDKEQTNFQGSTAHIQPSITPILKPDVSKTLPKPNIPYPSRLNDQKLREKATNQMEKFFQIFQDLHFDISFANALLLMPKFASTIKSLLTNKDQLFELAKIPLNENCSSMLFKKLLEKLRDPDKFLIPCDFPGMNVCHALADLGASINLMPLSIWKKLSLTKLTPTRMTLELADRSITRPKGVAKDVFVKVGKFYFSTDFVVLNFKADPRVNDEAVTFNLKQTTRYSSTYDDLSVNRIDIIDVAREEYAQDILGFSNNSSGGNPTSTSEPILSNSSPFLTPFEGSDSILEEIEAYLKDDPWVSPIHCVPKKGGITVVENENNELISTWYILVAVDYLSKWVEAKALPTNDARVVVKFLKSLFARFGTPKAIISNRDHRKLQLNELNELRDQAYENSLIYKDKTKKLHESKIKNRISNVGDRVLLFNSRLKIFSRKLKTRWSGPFTIAKVFPYGTVELSQPDGPNFKVNVHHVKHYFGGDVPQLVVPDL
uniref:Reverse transcriptase domain-containing protein n=1 Tax=Tanacetum cinerariifolium TaxID=118510 RepID=A0A6L2N557_TANCI|nr:reverse transcriptase domain-containing protein [Tanacetum cinerariifolium]